MNIRTTLWLLLACLGLWWIVQLSGRYERRQRESNMDLERFLDVTAEDVTMLTVTRGDLFIECSKRDGQWMIDRPLQARADAGTVDRLLSALESLSGQERIGAEQRMARELTLGNYGLEDPALRIVVRDKLGQKILFVGDSAPLGGLVYVQILGSEDVVAVPGVFTNAVPSNVAMLRDRALLHGDPAKVVRMEIDSNVSGFMQLARTDDAWMLQQPVSARADKLQVAMVLESLYELRVVSFAWDPAVGVAAVPQGASVPGLATLARVEPYGLGEGESVRVSVWLGAESGRQDLLLGKTSAESEDFIYAKLGSGPSVYTVPRTILDAVCLNLQDFRDSHIFGVPQSSISFVSVMRDDRRFSLTMDDSGTWFIVEPMHVQGDADAIRQLLADVLQWKVQSFPAVQPTNLTSVGLMPPFCTVEIGQKTPNAGRTADTGVLPAINPMDTYPVATDTGNGMLRIGLPIERNSNTLYYAAMGASDEVFLIGEDIAQDVRLSPENVSRFRDRTMLTTLPESVVRISVRVGDKEQSVFREPGGPWVPVEETLTLLETAVDDILFLCANMQATRVESMSPEAMAGYGLETPFASVTLGLTGESGIQKSVLLGERANGGGTYATVKGQDVVFVLPAKVVALLTQDVVRAGHPTGDQ